ncbi:hypothetical protein DFJ74DRAFT_768394 [Hyaloraphidium curvatum]|nr:hypothetical protein DFJ74DRAFT_768394 [Hyaloraphidium curvatum]
MPAIPAISYDTVLPGRPDAPALLARCRAELLVPAFGDGDLVDATENVAPQYLADRPEGSPAGAAIIASCGGKLAGCLLAEVFPAAAAWIVTYVVVDPGFRGAGVGKGLFSRAVRAAEGIAGAHAVAFAETEEHAGGAAADRFYFLARMGFRRLEVAYVQPPLAEGKDKVRNLLLLARTSEGTVPAAKVAAFLSAFYTAITADGWKRDAELSGVMASLRARKAVAAGPLIPELKKDDFQGREGVEAMEAEAPAQTA